MARVVRSLARNEEIGVPSDGCSHASGTERLTTEVALTIRMGSVARGGGVMRGAASA